MASTASPYGLRAVNEIGGLPYAGSTRTFLIDPAGTASTIYNGSPVYVNSSGYLAVATATGADATTMPRRIEGRPDSVARRSEVMSWCGENVSHGRVSHSTKWRTTDCSPAKKRNSASSWSAWRGSSARSRIGASVCRDSSATASAVLAPSKRPQLRLDPGSGSFSAADKSKKSSDKGMCGRHSARDYHTVRSTRLYRCGSRDSPARNQKTPRQRNCRGVFTIRSVVTSVLQRNG